MCLDNTQFAADIYKFIIIFLSFIMKLIKLNTIQKPNEGFRLFVEFFFHGA